MGTTAAVLTGIADLRSRVAGQVIAPDSPGFDEARSVWNGMIDKRPLAIVQARSVGDVIATVAAARALDVPLAVRGGGHNVAGNGTADGALVVDLGHMRAVGVDASTRHVRVQGGARLADVDAATEPHALAVPLGVISGTGVGGLTLGGGVGWLTRAHGLAADALVAVDVVTADGQVVTATAHEHADLFWALHGGGGNFGVATSFTFRAVPLGPRVLAGNLVYSLPSWRRAWRAFDAWTRDLPPEMTAITSTMTPPPALGMPQEPLLLFGFVWASPDLDRGQQLIDALRRLAPADMEEVGMVRWVEWQSAVDAIFPRGVRAYWRNTSFDRLDDEVIDVLVSRGEEQSWLGTAFDVHHLGGAFAAVAQEDSAFPHRDARFWINIYGFWEDAADDEARIAFVRGTSADMEPFSTGGQYVNFQGASQVGRSVEAATGGPADGHRPFDAKAVYGPTAYERLVAVKRRYDPGNLFRINSNISPQ